MNSRTQPTVPKRVNYLIALSEILQSAFVMLSQASLMATNIFRIIGY